MYHDLQINPVSILYLACFVLVAYHASIMAVGCYQHYFLYLRVQQMKIQVQNSADRYTTTILVYLSNETACSIRTALAITAYELLLHAACKNNIKFNREHTGIISLT